MKEIPLTKGAVALVDDCDYEWLSQYKWHINAYGYVRRSVWEDGRTVQHKMHREILGAGCEEQVDHINGNKLDNQRRNIRLCTNAENQRNCPKRRTARQSPYKGVRINGNGWQATIRLNWKRHHLGTFKTQEEAARVYNEAALRLHGAFASLNVIP